MIQAPGDFPRASRFESRPEGAVACLLCPRRCLIRPGDLGVCQARLNDGGILRAVTYGRIAAAALDPVEKKPLYHFFPGRRIFSIGGSGCNLKCVFCQNSAISQMRPPMTALTPGEAADLGLKDGSIGVAYTYNEPVVAFEFVLDCALAVRKAGGVNVLVTNGFVNPDPFSELLPLVDAINLDLKAFNNDFYRRLCSGSLGPVLETARAATGKTHLELTILVIPDENDAVPELEDMADWIAENCGRSTPCHLTAYHPSYKCDKAATTTAHLRNAGNIFRARLDYVYLGNCREPGFSDTVCRRCGGAVILRNGFRADLSGMNPDGTCAACGADNLVRTSAPRRASRRTAHAP